MLVSGARRFPWNAAELLEEGERFYAELQSVKKHLVVPDYGWYPYDSLSALQVLTRLLEPVFGEVAESLAQGPIVDLGGGDGDLGLFFARLGAQVDVVDHLETNFNQMRGITILREELGLQSGIHDINLDSAFQLPCSAYRFAFFLGTLYHLKNPYYVLENLALNADWCILSTRIARVTPLQTVIETEPVAYLLGAREANNDLTNYWIFSARGLLRILERAGWIVFGYERVGQLLNSDPVRVDADERMFILLKSRLRHPELLVRPVYGWFEPESNAWRWTARRFGLDVVLPADSASSEFALGIEIPGAVLGVSERVRVACNIDGAPAGAVTCTRPGAAELRGRLPSLSAGRTIRLDFIVESDYSPAGMDTRDLGVIVPLLDESQGNQYRLPFRIG